MKIFFSILCTIIGLLITSDSVAQKFKYPKLSTDVKKESKKYENEGWNNFPGNPPIGQQLNESFTKQNELDEEGTQKWFFATGIAVAQSLAVAELQAKEIAKTNLVQQLASDMKSFSETSLANNQFSKGEANSINNTLTVVTNKVSRKLVQLVTLLKIYRETDSSFEVQVQVSYNIASAKKIILDEVKKELSINDGIIMEKMNNFLINNKEN
jgi:hypothetical protein